MTKKELLEAIKDMPEDAEVYFRCVDPSMSVDEVKYNELTNTIELC